MEDDYALYIPKIRGKSGLKLEISTSPSTCLPPLFRPDCSQVAVTVVYSLAIFLQAEHGLHSSWIFGSSPPLFHFKICTRILDRSSFGLHLFSLEEILAQSLHGRILPWEETVLAEVRGGFSQGSNGEGGQNFSQINISKEFKAW